MYLTPRIFTDKPEVPEGCIAIGTPTLETVRVLGEDMESSDREGYCYVKVVVKASMAGGKVSVVDLKTYIWVTKEQMNHMGVHMPVLTIGAM